MIIHECEANESNYVIYHEREGLNCGWVLSVEGWCDVAINVCPYCGVKLESPDVKKVKHDCEARGNRPAPHWQTVIATDGTGDPSGWFVDVLAHERIQHCPYCREKLEAPKAEEEQNDRARL